MNGFLCWVVDLSGVKDFSGQFERCIQGKIQDEFQAVL
ncbi:hypothetical protein VRK_32710 [Vibrio sp. MEBiC08052]|nr:hypothetical protein VRK_32710 [Vibrio sp. MEBiC08052]